MEQVDAQVVEVDEILEQYPTAVGLCCDYCNLDYNLEDYKILKESKKLIYFATDSPEKDAPYLFCHECFFKYIKKKCGGKKIRMVVTTKDEEITMSFTPHEVLPEDPNEDSDENGGSYLDLF